MQTFHRNCSTWLVVFLLAYHQEGGVGAEPDKKEQSSHVDICLPLKDRNPCAEQPIEDGGGYPIVGFGKGVLCSKTAAQINTNNAVVLPRLCLLFPEIKHFVIDYSAIIQGDLLPIGNGLWIVSELVATEDGGFGVSNGRIRLTKVDKDALPMGIAAPVGKWLVPINSERFRRRVQLEGLTLEVKHVELDRNGRPAAYVAGVFHSEKLSLEFTQKVIVGEPLMFPDKSLVVVRIQPQGEKGLTGGWIELSPAKPDQR